MRRRKTNEIFIITIIFLFAAVVVISSCCYYMDWKSKADAIEQIEVDLFEYAVDNNNIIITFNLTNPEDDISAHFEAISTELIIKNRLVTEERPKGVDIKQIIVRNGTEQQTVVFEHLIDDGKYRIDLQLVTQYAVYHFDKIYIF